MNLNTSSPRLRYLWWAAALFGGVALPLLGLAGLLGSHPDSSEPLPPETVLGLPFLVLAPVYPSWPIFILVLISSAVVWSFVSFWAARLSEKVIRRIFSH